MMTASTGSGGSSNSDPLLKLAFEGDRVGRAAQILEREGPKLLMALRRALPFLGKRRVPMKLAWARARPLADLASDLNAPVYTVSLSTSARGAKGALLLDAGAMAMLLDGILGGDGKQLPVLDPKGLSAPQTALVSGVASNIVTALSNALQPVLGVALQVATSNGQSEGDSPEGALIACALAIGTGPTTGHVILCVPKELVLSAVVENEPPSLRQAGDPRIESVLEGVELEMVAELGRVRMRVRDLAKLAVGDVLRLDVAVNSEVTLRLDEHEIFRGRPTTSAGQIALALSKRADRHDR